MAKQIDLTLVQELVERGQEAEGLRKKLQDQVGKVQKAQEQLAGELEALRAILGEGRKAGARGRGRGRRAAAGGKEAQPKPGSAPEKLCKVMSATRPMQVSEIAAKTKLSEGTVKQYLHKFECFQSAGRGKGYLCKSSSSAGQTAGAAAAEAGQRGGRRGMKKASRKKAAE
jgi:hypothetical protein